jgi:PKD repeat protein
MRSRRGPGREFCLQPLGTLLVAVLFGFALAAAPGLLTIPGRMVARACGSGAPVMQANGLLATLDPATFNSGTTLPDTGGIFHLDYAVGQPIAFTETLDYTGPGAPPLSSLKLRWKFGDNSAPVIQNAPSHTYGKPGTYLVYVDYYESTSQSWQFFDYAHINIIAASPLANPPQAHAAADASVIYGGTNVTLDASESKSLDGSPLTYTWDFNDGTRATGMQVSHAWGAPGKTLVELIVTDVRGAKTVDTLNLNVTSDPSDVPTAGLTASATSVTPGSTVTLDASQSQPSANKPDVGLARFVWNFGDGSAQQTTTTPKVTHTFQKVGQLTVTVLAVDQANAGGEASLAVTVAPTPARTDWTPWAIGGIALAGLVVGGYFLIQSQRRYHALVRERRQAMELARARRVTERRPALPRRQGLPRPSRPPGRPR